MAQMKAVQLLTSMSLNELLDHSVWESPLSSLNASI
jgi:hypothetical protein